MQHTAPDHLALPFRPQGVLEVRQRVGARHMGLAAAFLHPLHDARQPGRARGRVVDGGDHHGGAEHLQAFHHDQVGGQLVGIGGAALAAPAGHAGDEPNL